MGFKEQSPEYQACTNFLEATKQKLGKTTEVVDLVCPMNRPEDRAMSQRNRQTIFVTLARLQKLNNLASKRFWLKDFKIGRKKKSSVKVMAECRHMRSLPIFFSHQIHRQTLFFPINFLAFSRNFLGDIWSKLLSDISVSIKRMTVSFLGCLEISRNISVGQ